MCVPARWCLVGTFCVPHTCFFVLLLAAAAAAGTLAAAPGPGSGPAAVVVAIFCLLHAWCLVVLVINFLHNAI